MGLLLLKRLKLKTFPHSVMETTWKNLFFHKMIRMSLGDADFVFNPK